MMPEVRAALRTLASNVANRRHAQRRSIEALALQASMAPRRWALIEAGKGNPTLTTLVKVAVALGVDVAALLSPAQR
jgi:XRE family transcriptional regulator, regulator of sulfur utilization